MKRTLYKMYWNVGIPVLTALLTATFLYYLVFFTGIEVNCMPPFINNLEVIDDIE